MCTHYPVRNFYRFVCVSFRTTFPHNFRTLKTRMRSPTSSFRRGPRVLSTSPWCPPRRTPPPRGGGRSVLSPSPTSRHASNCDASNRATLRSVDPRCCMWGAGGGRAWTRGQGGRRGRRGIVSGSGQGLSEYWVRNRTSSICRTFSC